MISIIVVFLFELSYRFSIIDFYKSEFQWLNRDVTLTKEVDYLAFGDSFSAAKHNYLDFFKTSTNKTLINSSVPGIGIKQVNTFVNRRLDKYSPKNVIYQVYVGNDLTDVDHLTNFKELSVIRNLYWSMSNKILSISYINQKLGSFKSNDNQKEMSTLNTPFTIKNYNSRSKIFFKSDSTYLYKAVLLEDDFRKRYSIWIDEVHDFINEISEEINIYIVFIPHCAQLNSYYQNNMIQLGATFLEKDKFNMINYPFFRKASLDLEKYKNVYLLNPLQTFKKEDTLNNRLYYLDDPHLNDNGHRVLGRYLKKQLLLNK